MKELIAFAMEKKEGILQELYKEDYFLINCIPFSTIRNPAIFFPKKLLPFEVLKLCEDKIEFYYMIDVENNSYIFIKQEDYNEYNKKYLEEMEII